MKGLWLIRAEQLAVFDAEARRLFEAEAQTHVRKFFAAECASLSQAELAEAVSLGIASAERYGIRAKGDVCSFLNLRFALGSAFDTELEWAASILADEGVTQGSVRIQLLVDEAIRRLREGGRPLEGS